MTDNLKPCTWCGSRPKWIPVEQMNGETDYELQCLNESCLINPLTMLYPTREEAIQAWNNRKGGAT